MSDEKEKDEQVSEESSSGNLSINVSEDVNAGEAIG